MIPAADELLSSPLPKLFQGHCVQKSHVWDNFNQIIEDLKFEISKTSQSEGSTL
jgi:hypothetical protein